MKGSSYISPMTILSSVLPLVSDERMEFMPKGFYMSVIQQALEALALDSYFDDKWEDFDVPTTLRLTQPAGCFNIRNIYLFNGTECDTQKSQKVYWKRNHFTKGQGSIANNVSDGGKDPFFDRSVNSYNGLYYYNIQAGDILFSSNCTSFQKVMINYNGMGSDITEAPIIPAIFRRAVEDFVCEFILRLRMAKDKQIWMGLWKIYEQRLNAPYDGSWEKAINLVKTMHSSQREELKEYLGRSSW